MVKSIGMIVPTLGQRPEWLSDCIASIKTQVVDARVEIVVVAPTSAELDGFCRAAEVRLEVVDRKGLSAAINDGWRSLPGADYLAWLGDDDLLAPGALQVTFATLETVPRASGVYGDVRYIDGAGETLWLQRPGRVSAAYLKIGKDLVSQPGALFRGASIRAVGGIDESFRSAMDMDLFARLQSAGPLEYVPAEVGAFRLHDSNITLTKGTAGQREADLIRQRYVRRGYPIVRAITTVLDRIIYAVIRRLPAKPAPVLGGAPYIKGASPSVSP